VGRLPASIHNLVEGLGKLVASYKLPDVYKALHYVAVETALLHHGLGASIIEPPKGGALGTLVPLARRELKPPIRDTIIWMYRELDRSTPFIVSEGSVEGLTIELSRIIVRPVDAVVAHDGLSLFEFATCAAYLRFRRSMQAVMVDFVFVNPPGVTRYVSTQVPQGERQSLAGIARALARELNAKVFKRSSYVDRIVHEHGGGGWSSFVEHLDMEIIAKELAEEASSGCVLVFSDHGYDIVLGEEGGLYVTHGHKLGAGMERVVLPLSRFSFVLVAFPASFV